MNAKWRRYGTLSLLSFLGAILLWFAAATPSYSHWADLSVAEIMVGETETQMTLTFPTGLMAFADDNQDSQVSPDEVRTHQTQLQTFLSDRIRLSDNQKQKATLTINASETSALPPNLKVTTGTHSSLQLTYNWSQPVQGLQIHYNLFLPGVPTATCLATILHSGQVQNFIFSPTNQTFSLMPPGLAWLNGGSLLIAIAGSFAWGAMHALSPGHGKTIVGAYLVGSHATPKHALFLGLATTIAHTTGVFALGAIALFASQYILPDQLYPWLSVLSGLMVVAIGLNLFINRLRSHKSGKSATAHQHLSFSASQSHSHRHHSHEPHHHDHHHDDSHHHEPHHHHHPHEPHHHGEHSHHNHSHLPPGADGSPVTWRNLLALGISGGLVPCPSALVLLLSAIALGRIGFGLMLVLTFSLGLAGVLTGLGLLLVYSKRFFDRLPIQMRIVRILPAVSALVIALLGVGITTQALMQTGLIRL
ncbi:sulfite exporter TauE/SafE family protein [Coleofasciculus sp. FACHB-SPT9]|uniref:nickel/cobalt transporter n=1 Tax=Cyanophyceae TaxID=3028117 RepID=UPI0016895CCF|nr:sulfite exporter TauE/SafE family protein [Coleofasciculus sp. FACHB-SPT9]MBD1889433.1 sulfite exporter TauE/SafE family protein [Coleofasciculus sp. FACHB-SPT9]